MKKIAICNCGGHNNEPMPLISTYAFNGAEYWCPYCKKQWPYMNPERIDSTPELEAKQKAYHKYTEAYIDARGTFTCCSMEFDGVVVKREDFTEEYVEEQKQIIKDFKHCKDLERQPYED